MPFGRKDLKQENQSVHFLFFLYVHEHYSIKERKEIEKANVKECHSHWILHWWFMLLVPTAENSCHREPGVMIFTILWSDSFAPVSISKLFSFANNCFFPLDISSQLRLWHWTKFSRLPRLLILLIWDLQSIVICFGMRTMKLMINVKKKKKEGAGTCQPKIPSFLHSFILPFTTTQDMTDVPRSEAGPLSRRHIYSLWHHQHAIPFRTYRLHLSARWPCFALCSLFFQRHGNLDGASYSRHLSKSGFDLIYRCRCIIGKGNRRVDVILLHSWSSF